MLHSHITAFLAVVETGSFTAAAEKNRTTKARVSQQISALEDHLGTTLLHRSTRKIRLTQAGELYYEECVRAFGILSQAERQVRENSDVISGLISINSVGGIFAETILAPALLDFKKAYPEVSIKLDLSSQRVDLMADNYDLVVRAGKLEDSNLVARRIMATSPEVVASPAYLAVHEPIQTPTDLLQHNCLCGTITQWSFQHINTGEEIDIKVSGSFTAANGHIVLKAAEEGFGVARLSNIYAAKAIAEGRLVPVLNDWAVPPGQISLVYPKVRFRVKRIQLLVEFLVKWFEENTA